jgi:hypothetical protein
MTCIIKPGEQRCSKCRHDFQACYWNGVTRAGRRKRGDTVEGDDEEEDAPVAKATKTKTAGTSRRKATSTGASRTRTVMVKVDDEEDDWRVMGLQKKIGEVRAERRILSEMLTDLEVRLERMLDQKGKGKAEEDEEDEGEEDWEGEYEI